MIVISLFVLGFYSFFDFQRGVEQTTDEMETKIDALDTHNQLIHCLNDEGVNSMSRTDLEGWDRNFNKSKPDCIKEKEYSARVTVEQEFISEQLDEESRVGMQLAYLFDSSGSMADTIEVDNPQEGDEIHVSYMDWSKYFWWADLERNKEWFSGYIDDEEDWAEYWDDVFLEEAEDSDDWDTEEDFHDMGPLDYWYYPWAGSDKHNKTKVVEAAKAFSRTMKSGESELTEADEITTILYESEDRTEEILPGFTKDKESEASRLAGEEDSPEIILGNHTRMDVALKEAKHLEWKSETSNVSILMTDGRQVPGSDTDGVESPEDKAKELMDEDIELHGILFGDLDDPVADHWTPNATLMEDVLNTDEDPEDPGCLDNNGDLTSAINGEGRCWFADDRETLIEVVGEIIRQEREVLADVGGSHTCGASPKLSESSDLEIALNIPAHESHEQDWDDKYCEFYDSLKDSPYLEEDDIDVYLPSNHEAEGSDINFRPSDVGEPATVDGETYSYPEESLQIEDNELASCFDGAELTFKPDEYEVDIEDHDALNSWGFSSQYIVENHPWSTDDRVLINFGNSLPVASYDDEEIQEDIVENIGSMAISRSVDIFTFRSSELENQDQGSFGNDYDVVDLLDRTGRLSGGEFIGSVENYKNAHSSYLEDYIDEEISGETCEDVSYTFGDPIESGQTTTFENPIQHNEDLLTPGRTVITIRKDPIDIVNSNIEMVENGETRRVATQLSTSLESRSETYSVPEDLTVSFTESEIELDSDGKVELGVNGERILEKKGESIDLDDSEFSINEESNIQLFIEGVDHGSTDDLGIETDGETQKIMDVNEVNGDSFHNFTAVELGGTNEEEIMSICEVGSDECLPINTELDVEPFSLQRGTSLVEITADGGSIEVN